MAKQIMAGCKGPKRAGVKPCYRNFRENAVPAKASTMHLAPAACNSLHDELVCKIYRHGK